jgi:hypothetical protein
MSKQADDTDVDWKPSTESERAWDNLPPIAEEQQMQQTIDGQLSTGGITKMIVPTIMQCGCGGYLVTIPGIGTFAASTLEEIMGFVEVKTMDHFKVKAKKAEFPRILRDKVKDTTDSLVDGVAGLRKRVDSVGLAMVVLGGLLIGFTMFGGLHNEGQERTIGTAKAVNGSPVRGDLRSGKVAREEGLPLLPEVQLLKVRPTSNDGDTQRSAQDGHLRPVWGGN